MKQYGNFGCDIDIKSQADRLLERFKNYPVEILYLMCTDTEWYSKVYLATDQNRFLQYPEYLGFKSAINEEIDSRSSCFRGMVGAIKDYYEENGTTPSIEDLEWVCKEKHYFKQMSGALIPVLESIIKEMQSVEMPEMKKKVLEESYYQWGAYILLFRLYAHLRNIMELGYDRLSDITDMLEELCILNGEIADAYELVKRCKNNEDSSPVEVHSSSDWEW